MSPKRTPAEPSVLFVKPQSISADDKASLASAGIIVVEIDDPSSVKLVRAHSEISGSDMMMAALRAVNGYDGGVRSALVRELMKIIDPQSK